MFIDSHAHLDMCKTPNAKDFFQENLSKIVHISLNPQEFLKNYNSLLSPDIYFATGFYPDHAALEDFDIDKSIESLKNILTTYPHCALGEIGVDLKDDSYGSVQRQQELFEKQIILAEELNLPIVIHTRMSFNETFEVLKNHKVTAIFHCFSYGLQEAEQILSRGDIISFAGILTYPKSLEIQEVAKIVPLDQILFETDSPFLSPKPLRGKPNFPHHVRHTYEFFATLRNINLEELCDQIQKNFYNIYRINS